MIDSGQRTVRKTHLVFLSLVSLFCCVCPLCAPPYTTEKPSESDVVGLYVLADQTLTEERLDILQGRICEIDLRSDGTFAVTNFPVWAEASALGYELDRFVTLDGEWNIQEVGSVSYNWGVKPIWGISFAGAIDSAELVGNRPPYTLYFVYGDPDSGDVMIFRRSR